MKKLSVTGLLAISLGVQSLPTNPVEAQTYKISIKRQWGATANEWTPKENKNISCVFVTYGNYLSGVSCYPKSKAGK